MLEDKIRAARSGTVNEGLGARASGEREMNGSDVMAGLSSDMEQRDGGARDGGSQEQGEEYGGTEEKRRRNPAWAHTSLGWIL